MSSTGLLAFNRFCFEIDEVAENLLYGKLLVARDGHLETIGVIAKVCHYVLWFLSNGSLYNNESYSSDDIHNAFTDQQRRFAELTESQDGLDCSRIQELSETINIIAKHLGVKEEAPPTITAPSLYTYDGDDEIRETERSIDKTVTDWFRLRKDIESETNHTHVIESLTATVEEAKQAINKTLSLYAMFAGRYERMAASAFQWAKDTKEAAPDSIPEETLSDMLKLHIEVTRARLLIPSRKETDDIDIENIYLQRDRLEELLSSTEYPTRLLLAEAARASREGFGRDSIMALPHQAPLYYHTMNSLLHDALSVYQQANELLERAQAEEPHPELPRIEDDEAAYDPKYTLEDRTRAMAILGVTNSSNRAEIRTAYFKLRKTHPDKGGDGSKMAEINAARDTLLWFFDH